MFAFIIAGLLSSGIFSEAIFPDQIIKKSVMTEKRRSLTEQYCNLHYGTNSTRLVNPKMIVIHATHQGSFRRCYRYFKKETLDNSRMKKQGQGGRVNVGAHYIVRKDGRVIEMIPTDTIARHIIGFNHTAIGIENISARNDRLTPAQITANAMLIRYLIKKYPSIEYLIGHYEYHDVSLEHNKYFIEKSLKYKIMKKTDPGRKSMRKLRVYLWDKFKIRLKR